MDIQTLNFYVNLMCFFLRYILRINDIYIFISLGFICMIMEYYEESIFLLLYYQKVEKYRMVYLVTRSNMK